MLDLPRQGEGAATLESMIESRDVVGIAQWLDTCQGAEAVRTLSALSDESREQMLHLLTPEDAADVIEQLPEPQALDALGDLDPAQAARIIEELPSDEQADLLGEMDEEEADAILRALPAEDADEVRRLAAYEADVAGGLMITEFVSYPASASVAIVLDDLAANATTYTDYDIQYAYVTGDKGELVGVLPLRTLLLAPRTTPLSEIMLRDPVRVTDTMGSPNWPRCSRTWLSWGCRSWIRTGDSWAWCDARVSSTPWLKNRMKPIAPRWVSWAAKNCAACR